MFMFERSREPCATCLCSSLPNPLFMFERSREPCATCLRSSGVENPALLYSLFMFERSREHCATWLLVYVRAESRTFFGRQGGVENYMLLFSLFMFKHSIHKNNLPHNVYVRAESRTLRYLFTFERSREPCATCLRSSGVENLVYVRAFLTPCLCSSGVENPALLVHVRAESRTLRYLFTFERSREPYPTWHLVYVRAESRTFCYLTPCLCSNLYNSMFTFERSREPFSSGRRSREPYPTLLLVYVRALLTPCLCSSGVENPLSNSNITNYFLFE